VRTWSHARRADGVDAREQYRRAIAGAARSLAAAGVEVTFLSTCQGIPEYWTDDAAFAAAIVQEYLVGVPGIHVDTGFHAPEELMRRFGGFDAVVATRMHAAILALAAGTPVLGIAYEFKTHELMAAMGLPELAVSFEDVGAEDLAVRVLALLDRAPEVRSRIAAQVAAIAADAREPAHRIRDMLRDMPR
jgi:colanic acid/amylovoran biosynthesis protein